MRKQAISQAVARHVAHERRRAGGQLFAAAGDVVDRPLQPQQVFIVVRKRGGRVARKVHST